MDNKCGTCGGWLSVDEREGGASYHDSPDQCVKHLRAELKTAQKCDLCEQEAGYHLCQSHMDDMRFPDVFTSDEEYPEPGRMVLWHDGETYIGGYDPAGGWFAQGHECDDEQPKGRVLWAYLVDLEYAYQVMSEFTARTTSLETRVVIEARRIASDMLTPITDEWRKKVEGLQSELQRLKVGNALLQAQPGKSLILRCGELEAELQQAREAERWIPVEERLPDEEGYYMARIMIEARFWRREAFYSPGNGWDTGYTVTHWKVLSPEPQQEGG